MIPAAPTLVTTEGPKHTEDSFDDTYMGFSLAVNLWQSSFILGQAISAAVLTPLSDTMGRKPMLLLCMLGGATLTAVKYFCRKNFIAYLVHTDAISSYAPEPPALLWEGRRCGLVVPSMYTLCI